MASIFADVTQKAFPNAQELNSLLYACSGYLNPQGSRLAHDLNKRLNQKIREKVLDVFETNSKTITIDV